MLVREFVKADEAALRRMHTQQAFRYALPPFADDPLFLIKLVLEDDAGQVAMASLVRLTSEAYLLHDPVEGTPRQRWERLLLLHEATERAAVARGLRDCHCWIEPKLAKRFGRRLLRLGWQRPLWTDFVKELEA